MIGHRSLLSSLVLHLRAVLECPGSKAVLGYAKIWNLLHSVVVHKSRINDRRLCRVYAMIRCHLPSLSKAVLVQGMP